MRNPSRTPPRSAAFRTRGRVTSLVTAAPLLLAAAGLAHPHHLDASTAATWAGLHIALLPAFPLLTTGLVLPLRGKPRRDLSGALTVVAWVAAFLYAAYYTGLDAVAGIAAGTAARHGATGAVPPLFATGDALGRAGAYALAVSALATCAVLLLHHGARTLPGAVVLLAACWSFTDSHIFWPRGVLTMLAFAVAFALLTAAAPTRRQARQGPADPSAGPDRSRRF